RHLPCLWRADGARTPRSRFSAVSRLSGASSPAPGRGSRAGAILCRGRSSPAAPASGPLGSPRGLASFSGGRSGGRVGHVDPEDPQPHPAVRPLTGRALASTPSDERAADRRLGRDAAQARVGLVRPDELILDARAGVEIAQANPFAEVDRVVPAVRLDDLR